ncbi:MAG: hypothetical protein QOC92_793 [Acidimicrobiaceae bacterium]
MLAADLSGFTALSERLASLGRVGAEEVTDLLNRGFERMIALASDFGGDVLKFGGDALLIFFDGRDHTARASATAIGMRASINQPLVGTRAGHVKLRMSQGIHAGEFTLFLVGAAHRELFVTGPGVTATIACEAAANPGEILLSHEAASRLPAGYFADERPEGLILRRRSFDGIWAIAAKPHGKVDLRAFVPQAQQEQIAAGVRGEHRRATIAFLRFSNTDAVIEQQGVESLAAQLSASTELLHQAVEAHGVHFLATDACMDGGKFILTAGAPSSSGHDEDDMLHALRAFVDGRPPLEVRVGVHRGPVFVGDLGSPTRRTFTVMGDTVNLAARLMETAGLGQVVASRELLAQTRSRFATVRLEPFTVKGKSKLVDAAMVGRVLPDTDSVDSSAEQPFVGRATELRVLEDGLHAAQWGEGRVIEIVGEPGMGKSRLVDEFLRLTRPPVSLTIRGSQYLRTTPYRAVRSPLRGLGAIPGDADADETGERLSQWVGEIAPHLMSWLPLLAIPFDANVAPTPEAERVAQEFRRGQLERALLDLLAIVMPPAGFLLVEDAHWLDDASLSLIAELVRPPRRGQWLVVFTRRPGPAVTPADAAAVELVLDPLGTEATVQLAAVAADKSSSLGPRDVERLAERAGGNPLFVIELIAAATAQGSTDALPDSIDQLLTSRIDTLAPPDRLLLRDASVLGVRVDPVLLASAIGDEGLRSLARWEPLGSFLEADHDGSLHFRHALFQVAAYEGLSFRRRGHVHRAVGRVIERTAASPREVAGLLSLHFDASGDAQRAWRYSVLAGEDAAAKYANVEAAEFFDRALANTKSADVPHAEITRVAEAMGDRLELLSRYTEADAAYQRARKHTTDPVGVVRLLRKQGLLRERLGRNTDALRWLGRALRAAHQGGDLAGHGENLVALALAYGGVRYRQGRYRDAIEWAQRAATDARRINDQRGLAHALDLIDLARISYPLTPSPDLPGAALTIYEEMGDLVGQSSVLTNLALAAHQAGRWDDAVALNERAREVAQQTGDVGSVAVAMCNLGEVLCDQGRCDEARDVLSQARRAAVAARYEILIAGTTLYLGRTEARAGNAEKALSLIDDALLMSQSMGAATVMLDAQIRRAECLLALGRAQTALTVTESALTGIEHSDQDPNLRSAFFRVRGKSLLALHDVEGARAAIEQAIGLARTAGAPGELAESLLAQADVDDACGTPASTLRAEAFRIYRNLGVVDRVP